MNLPQCLRITCGTTWCFINKTDLTIARQEVSNELRSNTTLPGDQKSQTGRNQAVDELRNEVGMEWETK